MDLNKSITAAENFEKEITEAFNYLQTSITEHKKIVSDKTSFAKGFSVQHLLY